MVRRLLSSAVLFATVTPAWAQTGGSDHSAAASPAANGTDQNNAEPRDDGDIVVTGVLIGGSFPNGIAKRATVGVLGERALVDTPVSAKSFDEVFIADQIALTSREIASRDASFVPVNASALTGADGGNIRGFRSFVFESSFDGFANVVGRRMPLEFIERVDVLKGPVTLYSGVRLFGGTGGTINYQSKKPLDGSLNRAVALYGGGEQFGGHLDVSRRFGADDRFGVRANLAYRDGEIAIDGVEERNRVAHLAFNWRTGGLDLDVQYGALFGRVTGYSDGFGYAPGVKIIAAPDASRFRGPDWAFSRYDNEFVRAAVNYDLGRDWQFFSAVGASRHEEDFLNLQTTVVDTAGNATATYYPQFGKSDWGDEWSADIGVRGTLRTGPITHRLTLAASYQRFFEEFDDRVATPPAQAIRFNVYDPGTLDVPAPALTGSGEYFPFFDNVGRGIVLTDEISALDDRLRLTLGVRYASIRQESYSFGAPTPDGRPLRIYDEARWTPSAALLFKATPELSVYASYMEAVERGAIAPQNAINPGESTPPGVSSQYEVGLKADLGRFGATAALFEIERPSAYLDPVTRRFGLFGRDRHRGVELDFFGEVARGLRVYGSYAYLDAQVVDSAGGALDGNRPISVPEHVAVAGVDAAVPAVAGLALNANVRFVSEQFFDAQNARSIPSYTVVDAGVRYSFAPTGVPLALRVNVTNLFDKNYFQAARFNTAPGLPRTVRATLSAEF
jgi:iron complex outermembrane recepter protein